MVSPSLLDLQIPKVDRPLQLSSFFLMPGNLRPAELAIVAGVSAQPGTTIGTAEQQEIRKDTGKQEDKAGQHQAQFVDLDACKRQQDAQQWDHDD
jgi:hypothetical protein